RRFTYVAGAMSLRALLFLSLAFSSSAAACAGAPVATAPLPTKPSPTATTVAAASLDAGASAAADAGPKSSGWPYHEPVVVRGGDARHVPRRRRQTEGRRARGHQIGGRARERRGAVGASPHTRLEEEDVGGASRACDRARRERLRRRRRVPLDARGRRQAPPE